MRDKFQEIVRRWFPGQPYGYNEAVQEILDVISCTPEEPIQDVVDSKKLIGETDARIWAQEFKKLFPRIDEGLMLGWFANAILAGLDHAKKEQ